MPKHPRKRQKTSDSHDYKTTTSKKAARLAMLLDEESKDDEERRLESMLFGVTYQPKAKGAGKVKALDDSEQSDHSEEDEEEHGRGLQHLLDQDLFFIDNLPSGSASKSVEIPEESSEGAGSSSSESGNHSDSDEGGSEPTTRPPSSSHKVEKSKTARDVFSSLQSKPPAWVDPADTQPTKISLLNGPSRIRKLRQAVDEDEITGREYETRLRNQFERINPEPEWARKARRKKKGAKRGVGGEDSDDDDGKVEGNEEEEDGDAEGLQELLTSTGGILTEGGKRKGRVVIRQGSLAVERVRDANHSTQSSSSGEVRVVAFHPKPAVPVLCVATTDRRVRLFHIDGHLSPLLTTLHIPSLPLISSTGVLFHPSGNSLLVTGPRPFFYTHDLQQGTSTLHKRGLWGTGFDDTSLLDASSGYKRRRGRSGAAAAKTSGGGGRGGGGNTEAILHAAFSGGRGSMLAVAGRGGNVHLVDWRSGAGQVVGSLRCTTLGGGGGGGVTGLWWVPSSPTGSEDILGGSGVGSAGVGDCEKHLAVLTGEAEVYIWDVGQRRCVRRWKDEGGYRGAGRVMAGGGGPNGWLAIGSTSGYVNVYDSDSFAVRNDSIDTTSFGRENPKVAKALGHLTTPISTLKFNHDGQILAMASEDKRDALRLVHLPSLTAFANWPTSSTPLGHVTTVDFASRSEYIAIGNTRGRVLLYHLKDYGAGGGV